MVRRSKDGSIIINVGSDAQRHLDRVAKQKQIASERAAKREAKKAATRQRQALRLTGKRAAQMARAIQRQRDTDARRKAAREARKNWKPNRNRKKRPVHPKGAFATEKYNSYARRKERSRSLKASYINDTTWSVSSYIIKVSGDKAISCTCPDFTQAEGDRNWKGSNAGPFNPCKHMMAERKRKGQCVGIPYKLEGTIYRNSTAFGNQKLGFYDAPIPSGLDANFGSLAINGAISFSFVSNGVGGGGIHFFSNGVFQFSHGDISGTLLEDMSFRDTRFTRLDGGEDNC